MVKVITYDGEDYDLTDKDNLANLLYSLVSEVEILRGEINRLQNRTDYIATHYNHSRYNSEEE